MNIGSFFQEQFHDIQNAVIGGEHKGGPPVHIRHVDLGAVIQEEFHQIDMPRPGLRARDIDVTTVLERGMTGRDDSPQLEYAFLQGRVFYTYNVGHFCHLHTQYMAEGKNHSGIIVVNRFRYSIGQQTRRQDLIGYRYTRALMLLRRRSELARETGLIRDIVFRMGRRSEASLTCEDFFGLEEGSGGGGL